MGVAGLVQLEQDHVSRRVAHPDDRADIWHHDHPGRATLELYNILAPIPLYAHLAHPAEERVIDEEAIGEIDIRRALDCRDFRAAGGDVYIILKGCDDICIVRFRRNTADKEDMRAILQSQKEVITLPMSDDSYERVLSGLRENQTLLSDTLVSCTHKSECARLVFLA